MDSNRSRGQKNLTAMLLSTNLISKSDINHNAKRIAKPIPQDAPAKTKKYKSISEENKPYTPYSSSGFTGDVASAFPLLVGSSLKTFIDAEGHEQPIYTSAMFHNLSSLVDDANKENLQKSIKAQVSHVDGFLEIEEVTRVSPNDSPLQVRSNNVIMNRQNVTNMDGAGLRISTFSNALVTPIKQMSPIKIVPEAVFESSPFKKYIKTNDSAIKQKEIIITPELFKKRKAEKEKKGSHRSQQRAMKQYSVDEKKAKASSLARKAQIGSEDTDWQWLHLIADFILGEKGQHDGNMVAGTKYSNAEMIVAEAQLKKISDLYPEGFKVIVTAHMVESDASSPSKKQFTQIASLITYEIITADFQIKFDFNPQKQIAPHVSYLDYVTAAITGLLNYFKEKENLNKLDVTIAATPRKISKKMVSSSSSDSESSNSLGAIDSQDSVSSVNSSSMTSSSSSSSGSNSFLDLLNESSSRSVTQSAMTMFHSPKKNILGGAIPLNYVYRTPDVKK